MSAFTTTTDEPALRGEANAHDTHRRCWIASSAGRYAEATPSPAKLAQSDAIRRIRVESRGVCPRTAHQRGVGPRDTACAGGGTVGLRRGSPGSSIPIELWEKPCPLQRR